MVSIISSDEACRPATSCAAKREIKTMLRCRFLHDIWLKFAVNVIFTFGAPRRRAHLPSSSALRCGEDRSTETFFNPSST